MNNQPEKNIHLFTTESHEAPCKKYNYPYNHHHHHHYHHFTTNNIIKKPRGQDPDPDQHNLKQNGAQSACVQSTNKEVNPCSKDVIQHNNKDLSHLR